MRDFGLSEEETLRLLLDGSDGESWNQRCDPPWDDAELEIKIRNSLRYASNRPGCKAETYRFDRLVAARPAGGYGLTPERVAEMTRVRTREEIERQNQLTIEVEGNVVRLKDWEALRDNIPEAQDDSTVLYQKTPQATTVAKWHDVNDFAKLENIREYVIKDWLIAHGVTALLAKRGTGKSTVALDICFHLACDLDWCDISTMKGWKVIYICGEDTEGMILNVRSWAKHEDRGLPARDRFMIADNIIKMTDSAQVDQEIKGMVDWADGSRCLVVLDTWARATSGASANEQQEMDLAYTNAEKVAAALDGPMIACFHPPKDTKASKLTIRGSAVQEDASSGIWTLVEKHGTITLKIARAKGKGHGLTRQFKFLPVDLDGKDTYGDPLQGIVPIHHAVDLEAVRADAITQVDRKMQAHALAIFEVVKDDLSIDWTVGEMAKRLEGQPIIIGDTEENLPSQRALDTYLKTAFENGLVVLVDGRSIELVDQNVKGPGGKNIHYFRIKDETIDEG